MARTTAPLIPLTERLLVLLGDRLRLARLRRGLTAKQVAERAGMTPMTLRSLERGGAGVTMGAYLAVMQVLGLEQDLNLLAKEDTLGRALQDSQLPGRRRTKAKPVLDSNAALPDSADEATETSLEANEPQQSPMSPAEPSWIKEGGYISSEELSALLTPGKPKGQ